MDFEMYKQGLLEEWERFPKESVPIILFGAGIFGRCVLQAVHSLGRKAVCFCDNDPAKQGRIQKGLPVLSPQEALEKWPDAAVYICLSNPHNVKTVFQQLKGCGHKKIYPMDMLYVAYHIHVLGRPVNRTDFMRTLYDCWHAEGALRLYMVGVIITQKCTLACKECSHLMPLFHHPIHYKKENIIKSIQALAASVDAIEALTLLGGESLLHPDLEEICLEASKISNIQRVHILSNGTILPSAERMKSLGEKITYFQLNDYGSLSNKLQEVESLCGRLKVECDTYSDQNEWYPLQAPKAKNKSQRELADSFLNCPLGRGFTEMIGGRFFLCAYAAAATELGLIPAADYIDMLDPKISAEQKRLQMGNLFAKSSISACDACGFDFQHRTKKAEQAVYG